jgi:hypothetical protein
LQLRLAAVGQRMAYAPAQQLQAQQTRLLGAQAALRNAANRVCILSLMSAWAEVLFPASAWRTTSCSPAMTPSTVPVGLI